MHLCGIKNCLIGAIRSAEIFEILPPPVRIVRANLALHSLQRVQLRRRPSRSQISSVPHPFTFRTTPHHQHLADSAGFPPDVLTWSPRFASVFWTLTWARTAGSPPPGLR